MGISKIFSKKEPENHSQVKYEEYQAKEDDIFANRERSSSLIMNQSDELKLIEDDEELAKAA